LIEGNAENTNGTSSCMKIGAWSEHRRKMNRIDCTSYRVL
jgi:hypothetical protein